MHYCLHEGQALPLYIYNSYTFLQIRILRKENRQERRVKSITVVEVGVESQRAVLYVEGKRVDIEVTGADYSDWFSIMYHPIAIQVHKRDKGGCVFIHTAKKEVSREVISVCHHLYYLIH